MNKQWKALTKTFLLILVGMTVILTSISTSSAKEIERLVTAQGWELHKIKNYFGTGGTYQGLHYNFQKGELFFEIKFHTQESFNIKMANGSVKYFSHI